jgi:hypothetical protein
MGRKRPKNQNALLAMRRKFPRKATTYKPIEATVSFVSSTEITDGPMIVSSSRPLNNKQANKKLERDKWLEEEKRYQEIMAKKQ